MVTQMLEVGEETGQITDMLDKVADYYDKEVETATDSLTSAMEPLLVVLMGVVIGGMVICLYLPMFSIYQHIQLTRSGSAGGPSTGAAGLSCPARGPVTRSLPKFPGSLK